MLATQKYFGAALFLVCILASVPVLALEMLAGGQVSEKEAPKLKARTWLSEHVGLDATLSLAGTAAAEVTPLYRSTQADVSPYLGIGIPVQEGLELSDLELALGVEVRLKEYPDWRVTLEMRASPEDTKVVAAVMYEFGSLFAKPQVEEEPAPEEEEEEQEKTERDHPDLMLLAKLISAEAKGEPYLGQVAVGAVVINRVKSPYFPNTIRAVIYQPGQFSPVRDGSINNPPTQSSIRAAREALAGRDPTHGALYFYNPHISSPRGRQFMRSRQKTVQIGQHVFCK